MSRRDPPPGFAAHRDGPLALLARPGDLEPLVHAGWADPRTWERSLAEASGPGRGGVVREAWPGGRRAVLKRMRRGGLLAPLWRDRYPGAGRLLDNLRLPLEASRRGVPTAEPLALLLRRGRAGLYEAWLAVEEIAGAVDLGTRLARAPAPDDDELGAALAAARRMHDAGVEHRDLNLANLLVRRAPEGCQGFVIDLDRAVLHARPVSPALRRRALERLARSWIKSFGEPGPLAEGPAVLFRSYAGDDPALARALGRGTAARRARLALRGIGRYR